MGPAALSLLADHASLYRRMVAAQARSLHEATLALVRHKNTDLRRTALRALDAIVAAVRPLPATHTYRESKRERERGKVGVRLSLCQPCLQG
jgi:hypothetical protein